MNLKHLLFTRQFFTRTHARTCILFFFEALGEVVQGIRQGNTIDFKEIGAHDTFVYVVPYVVGQVTEIVGTCTEFIVRARFANELECLSPYISAAEFRAPSSRVNDTPVERRPLRRDDIVHRMPRRRHFYFAPRTAPSPSDSPRCAPPPPAARDARPLLRPLPLLRAPLGPVPRALPRRALRGGGRRRAPARVPRRRRALRPRRPGRPGRAARRARRRGLPPRRRRRGRRRPLRFRDDLGRALEYHADTAIPADAARLPEGACDVVVVAGRDPHRAAVDRACRPSGLAFVGLEGTAFDHDPRAEEPQGVVQLLHTDPAFRARFASFHLVSAEAPAVVLTWDFPRAAGARAHA